MKDFEPQKLFIGVIDLFSILLPGALVAFLLRQQIADQVPDFGIAKLDSTQAAIVFLFLAYLIGHFVFLIGSGLLDDGVYDPIVGAGRDRQVERVASGKKPSVVVMRWLAAWLAATPTLHTIRIAQAIKDHYLATLGARSSMNTFQWSKARLAVEAPAALAGVQRFEADSKFFRSLVVVLVPLAVVSAFAQRFELTVLVLLLIPLALWRYFDQRIKATRQAYWHVIELESRADDGYRSAQDDGDDTPTHAGGVVFRQSNDNKREYLIVQASREPREWVLPKGHIQRYESMRETAVREVHEETGVWATPVKSLDVSAFEVDGATVRTRWYLMRALTPGSRQPVEDREHEWVDVDGACQKLEYADARKLVQQADGTPVPDEKTSRVHTGRVAVAND